MGRPDKNFEIETELRYNDPGDMSEWNESCYFDVSPGDSRDYYNGDLAPEIIEYWLQEKILEEVIGNKVPRRQFAKTLDDMIDDFDMRNKVLHSDYLSASLSLFQKERNEIGNTAIDKSDLHKRLKYRFFKMSDYRMALDR